RKEPKRVASEDRREDDLRLPTRPVLRDELSERLVATPVAPERFEHGCDVLLDRLDPHGIGSEPRQRALVAAGFALRHAQAADAARPEGSRAERKHDAAVDSA